MISQATDKEKRYKPTVHNEISVGDIVLIQEDNTKQANFLMAIVEKIKKNDLGEVVGTVLRKGSTGERVKRHSSVLIPLLKREVKEVQQCNETEQLVVQQGSNIPRSKRRAALAARKALSRAAFE